MAPGIAHPPALAPHDDVPRRLTGDPHRRRRRPTILPRLGSSRLDRPSYREPDPPLGQRLVLLERLLASGVLESTCRRRARRLSGPERLVTGANRCARVRGRIDQEPPGRTGSVARIGDIERNYGRRHRTCPTRARRRDQPAGSLECRAAAPAQVPHQGNATPANVEWSFEIDVFDCRRNGLRVLIRGSTAPAIVRYTGGAPALEERVVAGRRWTPIWVALRRQPGTRLCVAHFEPASMVDIGTIAHVGAIGLPAAEVAGAQSP